MKNSGGIKIIMIAALALVILAGTGAAVSLSNSGGGTWKYQRDITIKENSGTALTDYQVLVELRGTDFLGEAQNSGADVRFTDSNGNELNYWIESWDYAGKSAKTWVKVQSIPAGSTTVIRMYYGNPSARAVSEGDKVFEFFDDFGTGMYQNKWTTISGTWKEANGILTVTAPSDVAIIYGTATNFGPMVIEFKVRPSSKLRVGVIFGRTGQSYHYTAVYDIGNVWGIGTEGDFGGWAEKNSNRAGASLIPGIWYNLKLVVKNNGDIEYYKDNDLQISYAKSTISIGNVGLSHWYYETADYDDFLVRKYASSEPTITFSLPKSSSLSITKSASPYSLRQFQETTIKVSIENSGITDIKAIEIMDSIHPSFDIISGDFPNPKKYDIIRQGESREIQYTIKAKESGTFTLDPATVTYADGEGNIQEVKSEPVSIKVIPSSESSAGTPSGQLSKLSASVSLTGEKTDVVLGEDILLKLSAVNLITKPKMRVQVIIIPPSGMSVTSSEFSKSGTNQFTANYELEPGDGKDIGVAIKPNQIGDFNVNGRIIYYFGDEKDKAVDQTLNLPIKVRKEIASTPAQNSIENPAQKPIPGFEVIIGISGLLLVMLLKRKQ